MTSLCRECTTFLSTFAIIYFKMPDRCTICFKTLRNIRGIKKRIRNADEVQLYTSATNVNVAINDIVCGRCRLIPYTKRRSEFVNSSDTNNASMNVSNGNSDSDFFLDISLSEGIENEYMELSFQRVASTHKYCILCGNTVRLQIIPLEARYQVFTKQNIFIPTGDRCCSKHLLGDRFFEDELVNLRVVSHTSRMASNEILSFLNTLSTRSYNTLFDHMSDYNLPEKQLKVMTGLNWENIIEIRDQLISLKNRN